MMRSLFSGVAGLKTHQTRMDVIGNNIANVNTTAYKSQSMTFSDIMYQTTQNASGASERTGGVNARQIGLGVQTSAISTAIDQQGASQTTNNPFDIMINGSAFFVVNNGTEQLYTRDGTFYVDGAGNLAMQSTGYFVQGWNSADGKTIDINSGIGKLQIMNAANTTYPPAATTNAVMSGNVDQNDPNVKGASGRVMTLEFYDDRGYLYTAKFSVKQRTKENGDVEVDTNGNKLYSIALTDILDQDNKSIGEDLLSKIKFGDEDSNAKGALLSSLTGQSATDLVRSLKTSAGEDSTLPAAIDWSTASDNAKAGYVNSMLTGFSGKVSDLLAVEGAKYQSAGAQLFGFSDAVIKSFPQDATFTIQKKANPDPLPTGFNQDEFDMNPLNYEMVITQKRNTLAFDPDTGAYKGAPALVLDFSKDSSGLDLDPIPEGLESFKDVSMDVTTITNVNTNGSSTFKATKGDIEGNNTGRMIGEMNGISVEVSGKIWASYSNGQSKLLGQIASAEFANASGLEKSGDNLYRATNNSGEATVQDITTDGGRMSTGVLEMSNVDLSSEFTTMITTQRGFQANSRIITVSDTLLEELTNLKR